MSELEAADGENFLEVRWECFQYWSHYTAQAYSHEVGHRGNQLMLKLWSLADPRELEEFDDLLENLCEMSH